MCVGGGGGERSESVWCEVCVGGNQTLQRVKLLIFLYHLYFVIGKLLIFFSAEWMDINGWMDEREWDGKGWALVFRWKCMTLHFLLIIGPFIQIH